MSPTVITPVIMPRHPPASAHAQDRTAHGINRHGDEDACPHLHGASKG